MVHSMTGFGRATSNFKDKVIQVELRAVNSKGSDFRFKLPNNYRDKEVFLRKILQDRVDRGKVDVTIEVISPYGEEQFSLNKLLFKKYHQEISDVIQELQIDQGDLVPALLRVPNVLQVHEAQQDQEEWQAIEAVYLQAVDAFIAFRIEEGAILIEEFKMRVDTILKALESITPFEEARIPKMKEKLLQLIQQHTQPDQIDKNRLEQELIYYIEKLDITEEKVRLTQHCKYFLEELSDNSLSKGRKLTFISQEMGREINTLGSKANHAEIQKLVVTMKDELEKIKEQLANIV
jgi:uncharacterized protein (TIGR00255 family)